jgi:hypothetical protein
MKKWLVGLIVAVVTAALVQAMTGAFTSIGGWVLTLFTNQDPLQVAVERLFSRPYVIPLPIDQIPQPPSSPNDRVKMREQWASSLGAIDADSTVVRVVVTGRSPTPVVITDLRVIMRDRRPPLQGICVSYSRLETHPSTYSIPVRTYEVSLDAEPPKALQTVKHTGSDPLTYRYAVSVTESEVFRIVARVRGYDCTWVGELAWMSGDRKGSIIIDDNGKPFRTTSTQNAPTYYLEEEGLRKPESVHSMLRIE